MNERLMKESEEENPRRMFIRNAYRACGFLVAGAIAFTGCGKQKEKGEPATGTTNPADCGDLSAVSEEDIAVRNKLGYVKESPLPDNQCQNCNLYLPPKSGEACGGCMLFKGPVYAEAYCTYWAPKI